MGYRVLVVDDSPVLRLMLQEMLESFGHEVVAQADTGAEGLRFYKETKPDLVTLDISLPDQDGISVLKEMRRLDPQAKVVIITGNDQRKLLEQALALKALGVLRKPFDTEQLGALLEKIGPEMRSK